MTVYSDDELIAVAERGVNQYLDECLAAGRIDSNQDKATRAVVVAELAAWLGDEALAALDPNFREGVRRAIDERRWEAIIEAYRQPAKFGTGGIRTLMAHDRESIRKMQAEGIYAPILKGPGTINNLTLLKCSAGVAKYGLTRGLGSIVIGYDSRVCGAEFAWEIARLFLGNGYTVYLFDEPCPFPELCFSIPNLKADLGVFISASHNDYRYNGYKLCSGNGSQLSPEDRDRLLNDFIKPASFADVKLCNLEESSRDKLIFLGGETPLEGVDYHGSPCVNMHARHSAHVKGLLVSEEDLRRRAKDLRVAYCAFHGAGRKAVPRLLGELGVGNVTPVTADGLQELNGMFPCFCSDPGREQSPDPGSAASAAIALGSLRRQIGEEKLADIDILIGTDPDADRCGVIIPVPGEQKDIYGCDHLLLPADDVWALLTWYRLKHGLNSAGEVEKAEDKFVALNHCTSDCVANLARKHGIGVLKTWVGFATIVAAIDKVWQGGDVGIFTSLRRGWSEEAQKRIDELRFRLGKRQQLLSHDLVYECLDFSEKRKTNIGAMEQSNGYSILGSAPHSANELGRGGHIRDKDGTLAAILVAEIAAYAKEKKKNLIEILDEEIFSDPDIGLFVTAYEEDPAVGEYPGLAGDKMKQDRLRRALGLLQTALAGDLEIAGLPVVDAAVFRTGKYDHVYPPQLDYLFPDEGVRFFLEDKNAVGCAGGGESKTMLTVRPSGTGNSLRFYLQLHSKPGKAQLLGEKRRLFRLRREIMNDFRRLLKAPR